MDGVFHGYDELDHERINLDFCWIPLEELKKRKLADGMEYVLRMLESGNIEECYLHLEKDGYTGSLY